MKYITLLIIGLLLLGCVQDTHLKTVHFKVDMTAIDEVYKVGIRGPFTENPWQDTIYFTDTDNDGIYEGTITKQTAQSSVSFKFVNRDSIFELEHQNNRQINFKYQPETIQYEAVFDKPLGKQSQMN
ncbi:hypothetical protein [uncultured Psychroserpens sp.]|uniref:hypothetical protein n=1 Tax=uncultured Psychroserpens sp. TaxID=255436 RepID=UPI00262B52F6|nr:hypothetical protein [uncultured Psychroserpens sp.]